MPPATRQCPPRSGADRRLPSGPIDADTFGLASSDGLTADAALLHQAAAARLRTATSHLVTVTGSRRGMPAGGPAHSRLPMRRRRPGAAALPERLQIGSFACRGSW